MHFCELVHLLPHHDLLMLHLQTLVLGRRNDDDGSTLHWRTCPCTRTHPHARTHPNARLARVLALHLPITTCITQGIRLTNAHETYANHQYEDESHKDGIPFAMHCLQCSMVVSTSSSASSTQGCFLDHSTASLHSLSAAALTLAASASRHASSIHSRCFHSL